MKRWLGAFLAGLLIAALAGTVLPASAQSSPPVVESVVPAKAFPGTELSLSVLGKSFASGATAWFEPMTGIAVLALTRVSGSELRATLSIAPDAPAGTRDVVVGNPDRQQGILKAGFTIRPAKSLGALTLVPAQARNPTGTQHAVTATLADTSGKPVVGVKIGFQVTGANPGSGSAYTDQAGQAGFAYTGSKVGDDAIAATAGTLSARAAKQWHSPPPAPASLTLAPPSAENPVPGEHRVVATVLESAGKALAGVEVSFQVTGLHQVTGTVVTDANGQAAFSYPGTRAGDDTITATAGKLTARTAVRWYTPVPDLIWLAPAQAANPVGSTHTVVATLFDAAGRPAGGVRVFFQVTGANSATGSAVTDASGQASFSYVGTKAGDDQIAAMTGKLSAGAAKRWVVTAPGPAKLLLTPEKATSLAGSSHKVVATVLDAVKKPVSGVRVTFQVSGAHSASGSATTDASGQASFTYKGQKEGEDAITATGGGLTARAQQLWTKPGEPGLAPPVLTNLGVGADVLKTLRIPVKLPEFVWRVADVKGTVEISVHDGPWRPAVVGMRLPAETGVSTGFGSEVVLERLALYCAQKTVLSREYVLLTSLTDVRIGEIDRYEKNVLEVSRGKTFVARVPGIRVDFRVVTPRLTSAPKGTRFSVAHDPGTATSTVDVLDGAVVVTDRQTGQTAEVTGGQKPQRLVTDETGFTIGELPEIAARGWSLAELPPQAQADLPPPQGVEVSLLGENFQTGALISVSPEKGLDVTNARIVGPGEVRAELRVEVTASLGARDLAVANPDGQRAVLPGGIVLETAALPPPHVASVDITTVVRGMTIEVAVGGDSFAEGAALAVSPPAGIAVSSVRYLNPAELKAVVTVAGDAPAGPRDVVVTNPDGQKANLAGALTVQRVNRLRALWLKLAEAIRVFARRLAGRKTVAVTSVTPDRIYLESSLPPAEGLPVVLADGDRDGERMCEAHVYLSGKNLPADPAAIAFSPAHGIRCIHAQRLDEENVAVRLALDRDLPLGRKELLMAPEGGGAGRMVSTGHYLHVYRSLTAEQQLALDGQILRNKWNKYRRVKEEYPADKGLHAGWLVSIMRELNVLPPRPRDMSETDYDSALLFGLKTSLEGLAEGAAKSPVPVATLGVLLELYKTLSNLFDPGTKGGQDLLREKLLRRGFSLDEAGVIIDEIEQAYKKLAPLVK